MITEFQKKKLAYLFKFLDFNKNTYLQLDDFSDIATRICEKRGYEFGSHPYQVVSEKCVKFYHHILKDMAKKSQQQITASEWFDFFDKEILQREDDLILDEYVELILGYVFGLTDENNDGFISREEYTDIFSTFGIGARFSELGFKNMDANLDGKLSRYEVKHAIETFLTSDDPEDRANWVFGNWETDPWQEV